MKKNLLFAMFLPMVIHAQNGRVGINTENPKATLDVQPNAANALASATTNEGIIAPKLTKDRIAMMTNPESGTLVYALDANPVTSTTEAVKLGRVAEIDAQGYYYYRVDKWVKFGGSVVGTKGADGKSMLSGNGVPDTALGITGDTYLDRTTGLVWSKASGTWVNTNQSLKGPQGDTGSTGLPGSNGTDGKSMLSGNGAPYSSVGITGDTYLDRLTGLVWSKASGTWVNTYTSLRGPNGASGASIGSLFSSLGTCSASTELRAIPYASSSSNTTSFYVNDCDCPNYKKRLIIPKAMGETSTEFPIALGWSYSYSSYCNSCSIKVEVKRATDPIIFCINNCPPHPEPTTFVAEFYYACFDKQ